MDLIFSGPVFEPAGYSEVNRNILISLSRMGVSIRLLPAHLAGTQAGLDPRLKLTLERMMGNTHITRAPFLCINIGELMRRDPLNYSIGFTMLECDRIPPSWAFRCNQMDEVWVPSSFNLATFMASGVDERKLMVMPLGVDEMRFRPGLASLDILGRYGFKFLSVFEWVPRKGYDILLQAYFEEFSGDEDVALLLRVHHNLSYDPSGNLISREIKELEERFCQGKRAPAVILLPRVLSLEEMPRLYASADCFVLPTRGEGWCMPAIEAMACGVPAIITNWSGHLEYIRPGLSYLIEVEGLEPVPPLPPPNDRIYAGAKWAKPSLEHLRYLMRYAAGHPDELRRVGAMASSHVRSSYTWRQVAGRICARLGKMCSPQKPYGAMSRG